MLEFTLGGKTNSTFFLNLIPTLPPQPQLWQLYKPSSIFTERQSSLLFFLVCEHCGHLVLTDPVDLFRVMPRANK
jgi:hypothetical protein